MSRSSSKSRSRANPPPTARIRIANENATPDREGPIPSSLSLLTARRPSLAPPLYDHTQEISAGLASYRDVLSFGMAKSAHPSSSPEDGGNFRRSLQIDMKELVGDAVGNVCSFMSYKRWLSTAISTDEYQPCGQRHRPCSVSQHASYPKCFSLVSSRRGLFIIDLEGPLEVPRFLPQGGTWDVADVQWNPHHARAEYIVSTSSEKL